MDIKELRIGNWVQDKRTKFQKYVTVLFDDNTIYLNFDGNEGDVWEENISDIEPIPITNRLLVDMGFEKKEGFENTYEYQLYIDEYGCLLVSKLSNTNGKEWSIHIDNTDFETVAVLDIQYVHQLQNIVYDALKYEF